MIQFVICMTHKRFSDFHYVYTYIQVVHTEFVKDVCTEYVRPACAKVRKVVTAELLSRKSNTHKHNYPADKKPIFVASYSLGGIESL